MENHSLQIWSGYGTLPKEEDPFFFSNQLSPLDFSGFYTPLNWEWDWDFPMHEPLFDPMPLVENQTSYPLMGSLPIHGEDFNIEYGRGFEVCDETSPTGKNEPGKEIVREAGDVGDDYIGYGKGFEFCDETSATGKNETGKEIVLYGYSNIEAGHEDLRKRKRSDREQNTYGSRELTRQEISSYFYMPITQAAKELNVGLTLLKKRCRELGINRWPHRKLMSLQTLIKNIQDLRDEGEESEAHLKDAVEILEQERKLMEEMPDMQLEEKTKKLRQACFKANYKKRKLREVADLGGSSAAHSWVEQSSLSNSSSVMFVQFP